MTLDFNDTSRTAGEWLEVAREKRTGDRERAFDIGVSYVDEYSAGVFPDDLVLVGAATGVGKTTLVSMLAELNAAAGRRVFFFALEAAEAEIESKLFYRELATICYREKVVPAGGMRFVDFRRGRCSWVPDKLVRKAEQEVARKLEGVRTYYKGKQFSTKDIHRLFLAHQDQADLIILDHIHYIDHDDSNENRALKDITKAIRDAALLMDKPVICVAHLRKKQPGDKRLLPSLDDFHGSSDLVKIATKVLIVGRAWEQKPSKPYYSPTYMHIAKDRSAGECRHVAMFNFDMRRWRYSNLYHLGTAKGGTRYELIKPTDAPSWAKSITFPKRKDESNGE